MKKYNILFSFMLIIMITMIHLIFTGGHQFIQTNKNFNIYLQEGESYVKSNLKSFPKRGYTLNTTESSCTSGGIITQNSETKDITVEVTKADKCNFYFDKFPTLVETVLNLVAGENSNSTNVIEKPAPDSSCTNTLAYDGTSDNNLRYVGATPCNYVTFNGEEAGWRIIGVMNNIDDGTGKKETRVKLIRNDALGDYSWDSSESSVNYGNGVNDWTQADLMQELNGDYLNTSLTSNTMWYSGNNIQKTGEYDYTKGLNAVAQSQIGDAKWYLGGMKEENNDLIPSTMYTKERGTEVWPQGANYSETCNDGACPRATSWTGKVALIYPSDYGYATAGGEVTNRSSCINTLSLYYSTSGEAWMNSAYSNCKDNDWITSYHRALTPTSSNAWDSFIVSGYGEVYTAITIGTSPVYPTVYLKSSVSISGGNGSIENPYILD